MFDPSIRPLHSNEVCASISMLYLKENNRENNVIFNLTKLPIQNETFFNTHLTQVISRHLPSNLTNQNLIQTPKPYFVEHVISISLSHQLRLKTKPNKLKWKSKAKSLMGPKSHPKTATSSH